MSQITQIQDFPLIYNQTQRATLGVPRSFQIIDDTSFLHLNKVDATGTLGIYISTLENNEIKESLLIDPSNLLDKDDVDIPDEIKALKERLRDLSSGISSFQYCAETDVLLFSLGSDVFLFSIRENRISKTLENVFLPLLSPNGKYIALCQSKDMKVFDISKDQYIKTISQDGYVWGQPDFISAEEMGRYVSIWFSPDSNKILSLGYSDENVELTQIQANKDEDAKDYKYPFAGTSNPKLLLNEYIIGGDSKFSEVNDEYYVNTEFIDNESISISLNRDQNILSSNSESFEYKSNRHIDLFNTIPKCLKNASWLHYDIDKELDTKHLTINKQKVLGTDSLLNVFSFSKSYLYFQINENGFDYIIKRISKDDLNSIKCLNKDCTEIIKQSEAPITLSVSNNSDSYIITTRDLESIFPSIEFITPNFSGNVKIKTDYEINFDTTTELKTFTKDIRVAITKPNNFADKKLPLLVFSYGGPSSFTVGHNFRSAIGSKHKALVSSWFASLGFIVVSIDGAGTPISTVSREDATNKGFYEATSKDQIIAVEELLKTENIDKERIAIMGWSFGGYLAGACISKRPDLFKAAIVGAPVTDWILYDTCYSERFLGVPNKYPKHYEESSLLNKQYSSNSKIRLIHGRSDDNVLYINSQKFNEHLRQQNVDVEFVTIENATHMVSNAEDGAKLLIDDALFLSEALDLENIKLLLT